MIIVKYMYKRILFDRVNIDMPLKISHDSSGGIEMRNRWQLMWIELCTRIAQ